ncbi:MAG: hypothetical protein RJA49_316 [Actinomycetota bacterium]
MNPEEQATLRDGASYDAIVVGGRAAGAATAMLLARHGMRTLLLERGVFGTDTMSTHALMRGGVLQLSRWGVLDRIIAAGTPPVHTSTFQYANERIVVPIKPGRGVDALYAPRRTVLDPALVDAASDAGAQVRDRTSVIDLVRRGDRVTGVLTATVGEGFAELKAPLVIGADGMRSTIARKVDAPFTRRGHSVSAGTYGYWAGLDTSGYEWVFRGGAATGVIPTNDGLACVFANSTPERIGRGGVDTILEVAAATSPDLAERLRAAVPASGTRTARGQHGYFRQASGPGWALVGDAGYLKDPISAHGLTDALRDAELLARAVIDGDGDIAATDAALREYEATRDHISRTLFDVVDQVASFDWTDARIADLLLQLSAAMTDEVALLTALDAEVAR